MEAYRLFSSYSFLIDAIIMSGFFFILGKYFSVYILKLFSFRIADNFFASDNRDILSNSLH